MVPCNVIVNKNKSFNYEIFKGVFIPAAGRASLTAWLYHKTGGILYGSA